MVWRSGGLARLGPCTCSLHPEWVLRESVVSQPSSSFGVEASADLLTCEHPTSDFAFSSSETAESPEGSPSVLPLCTRQGPMAVLVSGAASAESPWVQCEERSWVETHTLPS